MSEIFIDNDCKVCSAYGDWINKKNKKLSLNDQKNLSKNEIMLDTLVFKIEDKAYYFSDAVIMSIASLGGFYKLIYILKLFPKRIRDFFYRIFAKNRHLIWKYLTILKTVISLDHLLFSQYFVFFTDFLFYLFHIFLQQNMKMEYTLL